MMQLDEKKITALGHSAAGLLKNAAFDEAFQQRAEEHIMGWLSTKPEDTALREHYWHSIQELMGVITLMESFTEEKDAILASE